jgi:hypothetical protein
MHRTPPASDDRNPIIIAWTNAKTSRYWVTPSVSRTKVESAFSVTAMNRTVMTSPEVISESRRKSSPLGSLMFSVD